MSTDWPQIDTSVSMHSSNDLFGGDLFGDELIEMYAGTGKNIFTIFNQDSMVRIS